MELSSKTEQLLDESKRLVEKGLAKLGDCAGPSELKEIDFELTYLCNERCIMCDIWNRYKINPKLREKELAFDEIVKFFEKSNYLRNIERIVLSGGEPFLRKDLVDLSGYFIKQYPKLSLGILTNMFDTGLIIRKIESITSQFKPKDLWLGSSLDGIGENHDKIRGMKGAFEALVRSIDTVRKKFPRIALHLNFTLTPMNYSDLIAAFNFARSRNVNFSAQFAVPWEGAERFQWKQEDYDRLKELIDRIMEQMVTDYQKWKVIDILTGRLYRRYLLSHLYYWDGLVSYQLKPQLFFKRCIAGARFATFSPDGDLYFCPVLKNRVVGNIRDYDYDFDKLWMSDEAKKQREFINTGHCHCWLNCTIYPNIHEAIGFMQSHWERKIVSAGSSIKGKIVC